MIRACLLLWGALSLGLSGEAGMAAPGDFDMAIQRALQMDLNQTLAKAGLRHSMVTSVNLTLHQTATARPGIRAISVTLQTDEREAAEIVLTSKLRRDGFHIAGVDAGHGSGPVASITTVPWPTVAIPWVSLAILISLSGLAMLLLAMVTRWRVVLPRPRKPRTVANPLPADLPIAGMKRSQWLKAPLDLVIQKLLPMPVAERNQLLERLQLPPGVRMSLDRQLARELQRQQDARQNDGAVEEAPNDFYGRRLDPIQPPPS